MAQLGLISPQQAEGVGGLLARDQSLGDQDLFEQDDVMVLAEAAVQRFQSALVRQQPVAAASFEETQLKPEVLHALTPDMIVLNRVCCAATQLVTPSAATSVAMIFRMA